jgi:hypothetical protein
MNRIIYVTGGTEGAYTANFALQTLVLIWKAVVIHYLLGMNSMLESMVIKM